MKLFHFYRVEDHSGVSGTGPVVEGVEFTNGWCAIRWLSSMSSICFYQSMEEVKAIHGHGGKTEVIVHDFEPVSRAHHNLKETHFDFFLRLIDEAARLNDTSEDRNIPPEGRQTTMLASIHTLRSMLDELEAEIRRSGNSVNPAA